MCLGALEVEFEASRMPPCPKKSATWCFIERTTPFYSNDKKQAPFFPLREAVLLKREALSVKR